MTSRRLDGNNFNDPFFPLPANVTNFIEVLFFFPHNEPQALQELIWTQTVRVGGLWKVGGYGVEGDKSSSVQRSTDTVAGSLWRFVIAEDKKKRHDCLFQFFLFLRIHVTIGRGCFFFQPLAVFAPVSLACSRSLEMPQTAVIGAHRGWGRGLGQGRQLQITVITRNYLFHENSHACHFVFECIGVEGG